jgi:hypothetical protein
VSGEGESEKREKGREWLGYKSKIAGDEKKRERVRGVQFAACKCHESFRRQLTPSNSCSRFDSDSGGGANCPWGLKRCWIAG